MAVKRSEFFLVATVRSKTVGGGDYLVWLPDPWLTSVATLPYIPMYSEIKKFAIYLTPSLHNLQVLFCVYHTLLNQIVLNLRPCYVLFLISYSLCYIPYSLIIDNPGVFSQWVEFRVEWAVCYVLCTVCYVLCAVSYVVFAVCYVVCAGS